MAASTTRQPGGESAVGSAARPGWLKSRPAASASSPPPLPAAAAAPLVKAETPELPETPAVDPIAFAKRYPKSFLGWLAFLWASFLHWWQSLYVGWGMTTSLLLHGSVAVTLAFSYFSLQPDRGMLISGSFDEVRDGEQFDEMLDSRLDTSFGDKAASLEFVATTAMSDLSMMTSAENLIGGTEGSGEQAGEEASSSMAMNIAVPESAITRGSFTVWTEPEQPLPRVPYDIIIQVKLPPSAKFYRLNDLTGFVKGTDGYQKQIRYTPNERRGVKDGFVQVNVRIPGAAQLVKDVIQIRSRLLDEEQTIEIIFDRPS